jgi:hypothetical protein
MSGHSRRAAAAGLFCAAFVSPFSSIGAQGTAPVAIVDRITGIWRVPGQGMRTLEPQDLLSAGQTVLIDQSTTASIGIVFFAGGQRWERVCSVSAPCEGSYRPVPPERPSALGRFWSFFAGYWQPSRPLPPELMGSRSAGSAGSTHALLVRSGESVDLRPALARLNPGGYTVTLRPAGRNDHEGSSLAVQMNADRTQPLVHTLQPGLYSLRVQTPAADIVGADAIVLVADSGDTAIVDAWTAARAEVAAWRGVSPATVDAILGRMLYALADQRGRR